MMLKKFRNCRSWDKVPENSFTGADIEIAINTFKEGTGSTKLWDRLVETKNRLPWTVSLILSLQQQVIQKGKLSDKQRSLATSLYIDTCTITDERLQDLREARKLGFRLLELNLGRSFNIVYSIMDFSNSRQLSLGQMRALRNISDRYKQDLVKIPKLIDGETFDGWNKIKPHNDVDN